jgi:acyl carrier protein
MITATVSHDQISRLMLERVHIEVPSADTDLMELGLLDSLTLVELMANLEEEFGIHISFDEIELDNFRSVARIAEFVNQQSSLSEPAAIY